MLTGTIGNQTASSENNKMLRLKICLVDKNPLLSGIAFGI